MRNTLFRLKGEKREKEREKKVVSDTKKRHQTAHKKSLIGPFTTPTKIYARDYVITYTEKIEINKSTTGGGSLVCFFFFSGGKLFPKFGDLQLLKIRQEEIVR